MARVASVEQEKAVDFHSPAGSLLTSKQTIKQTNPANKPTTATRRQARASFFAFFWTLFTGNRPVDDTRANDNFLFHQMRAIKSRPSNGVSFRDIQMWPLVGGGAFNKWDRWIDGLRCRRTQPSRWWKVKRKDTKATIIKHWLDKLALNICVCGGDAEVVLFRFYLGWHQYFRLQRRLCVFWMEQKQHTGRTGRHIEHGQRFVLNYEHTLQTIVIAVCAHHLL